MIKTKKKQKKTPPPQKVTIFRKNNMTSSNLKKKSAVHKVKEEKKAHAKPQTRIIKTSIKNIKQEETTNTQNKRIWLSPRKKVNKISKKVSSFSFIEKKSINARRVRKTKR